MIPPTQREALSVLAEVVAMSPDLRLGQLFAHLGFLGEDQTGRSLGNIDDEELLAVLYHHRGELAARLTNAPSQPLQATGAAASVSKSSHVPKAAQVADL
jgi:hypothetical protein